MKWYCLFVLCFSGIVVFAQNYTKYIVGDTNDVTTACQYRITLMGGASEHDSAAKWFLEGAAGGDVVVLRTSGADGYNSYFYSGLGVTVNSVETIVMHNALAAYEPYVINRIKNAEALWFAGGNQWEYVSYWNNTPVDSAIHYLIHVKKASIGGTSAGMAIQGGIVFTAQYGTISSSTALNNPYHTNVTLLKHDFIHHPLLENVITDTHYDSPDRRGRHTTFIARVMHEDNIDTYGIACDEYTAVCIDSTGIARVYGEYPTYNDFAYFIQPNCVMPNTPEVCSPGMPLTWNRSAQALKVCKIPGTNTGNHTFNLNDWKTHTGGTWEDWYVLTGTLYTVAGSPPNCTTELQSVLSNTDIDWEIYPNPAQEQIYLHLPTAGQIKIYDTLGQLKYQQELPKGIHAIDLTSLSAGIYNITFQTHSCIFYKKFWIK
ncbi:MAG: T9SS type A sorting domain-containing protein [Bacteroidia bacterium]|nr:T9SS type A sorting domain-containing protein [Bacteroidia bacterium]MDW8302145.1 T9SS type A sorting domain-containing protein [Bacteroidia bacterium]